MAQAATAAVQAFERESQAAVRLATSLKQAAQVPPPTTARWALRLGSRYSSPRPAVSSAPAPPVPAARPAPALPPPALQPSVQAQQTLTVSSTQTAQALQRVAHAQQAVTQARTQAGASVQRQVASQTALTSAARQAAQALTLQATAARQAGQRALAADLAQQATAYRLIAQGATQAAAAMSALPAQARGIGLSIPPSWAWWGRSLSFNVPSKTWCRPALPCSSCASPLPPLPAVRRRVLEEFEFVVQTANRLGLGLQSVAEQYRSLSAATRGTTLEGQDTRRLFVALSQATVAYGLSNEQLGRALTAMQQIASKGKVSMEELRGQFGEALPGAMQIAARAFGVSTAELEKMLAKGVDAATFFRRFTTQLETEVPAATKRAGAGFRN